MARGLRSTDGARRLATAAVVLALLWPVVTGSDGLPLSTYPMYAGQRSETLAFVVARGITSDGGRTTLSMPEIAGTRDPLIAQAYLNDAVSIGNAEVACAEIAARVGTALVAVEIARERHNVVDYVRGDSSLLRREGITQCDVPDR